MDPSFDVVQVGSIFESTPESLHAMDEARRRHDAQLAALPPAVRAVVEDISRRVESAAIGGSR